MTSNYHVINVINQKIISGARKLKSNKNWHSTTDKPSINSKQKIQSTNILMIYRT